MSGYSVMGVAAPGIDLTPAEMHLVAQRAMEVVGATLKNPDEEEATPEATPGGALITATAKQVKKGLKKGVVKKGFMEGTVGYIMGPDGIYIDCHAEDVEYRLLLEGGVVYYDVIPGSQTRNGLAKAVNLTGPGISAYGQTRGYCKRWLYDKDMGFIQPEAGGEEIPVYRDGVNCCGYLREGVLVYYDVEEGQAVNVCGPGVIPRNFGRGKWRRGGYGWGGGGGPRLTNMPAGAIMAGGGGRGGGGGGPPAQITAGPTGGRGGATSAPAPGFSPY